MLGQLGIDMGPTGAISDGDYLKRMDLARSLIRRLVANAGLDVELEFVVNDGGPRRLMEVHLVHVDRVQLPLAGLGWQEIEDGESAAGEVVSRARAVVAQMLQLQTLSMDRLAGLLDEQGLSEPEVALLDVLDRFEASTARLQVDESEVLLCAQGHGQASQLPRSIRVRARVDAVGKSVARLRSVTIDGALHGALRLPSSCALFLPSRPADGVVQHRLLDAAIARVKVHLRVLAEVRNTTGAVVSLHMLDFADPDDAGGVGVETGAGDR